jgi:hypothetical protein
MPHRAVETAITLALIVPLAAACETTIPPTVIAPTAPTRTITGTMWVHGTAGVEPGRGRTLVPAFDTALGWAVQDAITLDADGRYRITAIEGMRLLLGTPSLYQPCAVVVEPGGQATVDVHVIEDVTLLDGNLPAPLHGRTPVLSGRVFESTAGGEVPVAGARVLITDGDFTVFASTLGDASGRYVLCGVPQSSRLQVAAEHPGYFSEAVQGLEGRTELNISLRRR